MWACIFHFNPALPSLMAMDGDNVLLSAPGQLTIYFLYPVAIMADLIVFPERGEACMASSVTKSVTINCLGLTEGMEYQVSLDAVIIVNGNNIHITIRTVFNGTEPAPSIPLPNMVKTKGSSGHSTKYFTTIPLLKSSEMPTSTSPCLHWSLL